MKLLIILLVSLSLTSCGGGGSKTYNVNRSISTGQELVDIKRALDSGAITQEEYDEQRKKILTGVGE